MYFWKWYGFCVIEFSHFFWLRSFRSLFLSVVKMGAALKRIMTEDILRNVCNQMKCFDSCVCTVVDWNGLSVCTRQNIMWRHSACDHLIQSCSCTQENGLLHRLVFVGRLRLTWQGFLLSRTSSHGSCPVTCPLLQKQITDLGECQENGECVDVSNMS